MPSPALIEAKRVRVTYVCPAESKLKGMNMEVEVVLTENAISIDYSENHWARVTCPLCSSFHEVLL